MSDKAYYIKYLCDKCPEFSSNSLTAAMEHVMSTMLSDNGSHDVYPVIEVEVEGM